MIDEKNLTDLVATAVYAEKTTTEPQTIPEIATDIAGFVGFTVRGPYLPKLVTSFAQFRRIFGGLRSPGRGLLPYGIRGFFENGGRKAYVARVSRGSKGSVKASKFIGDRRAKPSQRRGLAALAIVKNISMLALPDAWHPRVSVRARRAILAAAIAQCEARRDRIVFIDAPPQLRGLGRSDPNISQLNSSYASIYGPWLKVASYKRRAAVVPPSGHVAGTYARNDHERGVWKMPAGVNAEIEGILGLKVILTENELESLSDARINAIADFRYSGRAIVLWGARTASPDPEWKYVNVRRYCAFLESSIDRGTEWTVFEANDENLWAKVRTAVANFLLSQWRKGALVGTTPEEAFFVRCDRNTITQTDIDNGRLICEIGVAVLRPAEFVIFRIGERAKRPFQN